MNTRTFFKTLAKAAAIVALAPQLIEKAKNRWAVVKNIPTRPTLYEGWVTGHWFESKKYATFEEWLASGDMKAPKRRSGLRDRFIKGKWET